MLRRILRACCWLTLVLSVLAWGASEVWYLHKQGFGIGSVRIDDVHIAHGSVAIELDRPPGMYLDRVFAGTVGRDFGRITRDVHLDRLWLPRIQTRFGVDLVLPFWLLIAISLLVLTAPRWWPREPGRCGACKYDISATTLGVCPECGTPIEGDASGP